MPATRRVRQCSSNISSSNRVGAEETAVMVEGRPPCPSLRVEDDDADGSHVVTTATATKTEEVAVFSHVVVAAAGPLREGGAAAHRTAGGRNKRNGRSSRPSAGANTDAASPRGSRSNSKSTGRGGAKLARRATDDDVVVLEADGQPGGASGLSATRRRASVLGPGTKVAVKLEQPEQEIGMFEGGDRIRRYGSRHW